MKRKGSDVKKKCNIFIVRLTIHAYKPHGGSGGAGADGSITRMTHNCLRSYARKLAILEGHNSESVLKVSHYGNDC